MHNRLNLRTFLLFSSLLLLVLPATAQQLFDPSELKNPTQFGAKIADKLKTEEVYEYKFPQGERVILKNGFRKHGFINAEDWLRIKDTVDVVGVDIVYSKYPIRNGEYHEIYPLLFNRIKATITMDPALNSESIRWRKIWQTHCENNAQVDQLYHGVVIWYKTRKRPELVDEHTQHNHTSNNTQETNTTQDNTTTTPVHLPPTIAFILNHPATPDSIKSLVEGKPSTEQERILMTFYRGEMRKEGNDPSLDNPVMRMNYLYAVEAFMRQFPAVPSVVGDVLDRHPEWKEKVVVNDWTGSMYGYGSQVLLWHLMNLENSGVTTITLFNDGDSKTTEKKVIGRTGGIYTGEANDPDELIDLFTRVMQKGGGGDGPENDIEAILKVIEEAPDSAEIILIADNRACVRDIELADQIKRPVRIILCGYEESAGVNPDYVYLANITGGGIYTIEEDIEQIAAEIDDKGVIRSYDDDRLTLSSPQCFDAVFGHAEGMRYSLKKARFHKKKVRILDASLEHLTEIPAYVYKMDNLQSLNVSANQIQEIPEDILSLRKLSVLHISENNIGALPEKLDKLAFLEYVYAGNNNLTALPDGLYKLDFLRELSVTGNAITTLQKFDSRMLQRINVSNNQLTKLPSFNRNKQLIEFNAANNQLTAFPENVPTKHLEHLDLSFNNISQLPQDLTPYKQLKTLNLKGNPIDETERIRIREALFFVDLTF